MRSSVPRMAPTVSEKGVLIVGAGPTGLALANALAHYGVPFFIADKKPGPSSDSKGLTISLGTQYGLEAIGLKGVVGKHGYRIHRANIYWEGKKFSSINFANLALTVNSLITQPQHNTERDFLSALSERGFTVSWNTRLVDVEQSDKSVKATFKSNAGDYFSKHYDYAVGCEGKNSLVRESIGAVLNGDDYAKYLVLGDFPISGYTAEGEIQYHVYRDTFFILIPIGGGLLRVVVKYDGKAPTTPSVASEITSIVNYHMGDSYLSSNPVWLSRAQLYMRISDKLRKGRLFIAGDAAHLVSPIGGTGLNMGIQDAINLAWKIAFRYFEYADDNIFNAYETERLEIIRETVAAADRSTRIITGSWVNDEWVEAMQPRMKNRKHFRTTLPINYSGLGIRYSQCYATHNYTALPGARRTGEFCFGLKKLFHLAESVERFSVKGRRPRVMVVMFLNGTEGRSEFKYVRMIADLTASYGALSPIVALFDPEEIKLSIDDQRVGVVFAPVCKEEASDLGLVAGSMLALTPDGYIAYSGRTSDAGELEKILVTMLALKRHDKKQNAAPGAESMNRPKELLMREPGGGMETAVALSADQRQEI